MASADVKSIIDRAKQIYANQLKTDLESHHRNRFVAIEPESGEYFLGDTFDEAATNARTKYPSRLSHTIWIGYGDFHINPELDGSIIDELREQARMGVPVADLVRKTRSLLGGGDRMTVAILVYFREAFRLSLRDARTIEGLPCMGGAAISEEELDATLRPLIMKGLASGPSPDLGA